ncbi:thioredoxin domain-containing protein [Flagellimonas zhangzhouensis]|uniref:Thioredoxin n=1 Tax=Flagellimonas zhangzhouensis TaxID=1073328 RepID=A0A1H2WWQ9_9FLAO|nr:thioredoxin domain-containing protein [Allomuricauda zhangzhouensis]SDQ25556.1 Thioredoxin [Allomuricauda zhangzhouensis]SDW84946.1 Thioredoxin [Allomuricauda zhangzhouensis]
MIELIYFTGKTCGVCKVLKPKLLEAVQENFPEVKIRVVDVEEEVEFTGQSMVFTLPVVILKADDKEMYRFARSFSIYEVLQKLERLQEIQNEG